MGFCMHIEGVECDNCRGNRRFSQPNYPATPVPYIPHIITTTGTAPLPYTVPANLMATLEELRDNLRSVKSSHVRDMAIANLIDHIAALGDRVAALEGKPKPKKAKPKARRSRK